MKRKGKEFQTPEEIRPKKSQSLMMFLCVFLGLLGIHSLYAAKLEDAVRYWVLDLFVFLGSKKILPPEFIVFPLALMFLFWFIDLFKIFLGKYKDGYGRKVHPYY